jgi:hypothetical protein
VILSFRKSLQIFFFLEIYWLSSVDLQSQNDGKEITFVTIFFIFIRMITKRINFHPPLYQKNWRTFKISTCPKITGLSGKIFGRRTHPIHFQRG